MNGTDAAMVVDPPHPDTGRSLLDTPIPDWNRVRAVAMKGVRLLPGIRTQSWDIALTDRGPVLLEVNFAAAISTWPSWRTAKACWTRPTSGTCAIAATASDLPAAPGSIFHPPFAQTRPTTAG